ncbi:hypothetical protein LguiB_023600 [Lonicera macranthoides]
MGGGRAGEWPYWPRRYRRWQFNKRNREGRKADLVEPLDWHEVILASIERKANSMELSFSLRIMKNKKQWEQGIKEAKELAYSSASEGQQVFSHTPTLIVNGYLSQESKALCLETSARYDVFALKEIGDTNSVGIYKRAKKLTTIISFRLFNCTHSIE